MRNKVGFSHLLAYFSLFTCLTYLNLPTVYAEGTAELIPQGSPSSCVSYIQGNDGTGKEGPGYDRPWYDLIYVNINDPANEIIYYGFTRKEPSSKPLYYQILDPLGNIVITGLVGTSASDSCYIADDGTATYVGPTQIAGSGSGGYTALSYTPTMAGDYAIRFNVNDPVTANPSESRYYVHPFDVTVADVSIPASPVAITGRLFSYKWHLNTNGSSKEACMQFYTWTPDSVVVSMDMNGIQPHGYSVSFNDHGTTDTGDLVEDRKSRNSVNSAVPEYRVFLNDPDPTVYPTGTPGTITFVKMNGCVLIQDYCIYVNITRPGELNVYLDLTGNGQYDYGTRDVYFPYKAETSGEICIPWDGMDGLGNLIAGDDTGVVFVEFLAGVVHYPVWDPENHVNGFNSSIVRPSGLDPRMYFDNSETSIGTVNLVGCDSNCNTWSGSAGNNVMVNTWFTAITGSDTADFTLVNLCPPVPSPDSTCVINNGSLVLSILANDTDPDNSLDSSSVTITQLSGAGSYYYNSSTGWFSYDEGGDADTVRFTYEVCDVTDPSYGGPFCRESNIVIAVGACAGWGALDPDEFVPVSTMEPEQKEILILAKADQQWLQLKALEKGLTRLVLYDVAGREIWNKSHFLTKGREWKVPLSVQTGGIYTLMILTPRGKTYQKLRLR